MPVSKPLQQIERTFVRHCGRRLIYFGGCDYFRLSSHPEVLRAVRDGAEKFGLNVAASRSTTGNHALFGKLEGELAKFFAVESAALISSGYVTNLAFAQTFAKQFTHALIDDRSHGSLRDAAEFLDCPVVTFRHRDVEDLGIRLRRCGGAARPLVMTDGMFSHDGSLARLAEYLSMLPRKGMLLVDDAHGAGTLGGAGKGTPEVCDVRDKRIVQTISLSKAFGVYGGAVLGAAEVIEGIVERSRIFNGNTPLPLPLANAALASLRILRRDGALRERLRANVARIKNALCVPFGNSAPLVTFTPRDTPHASQTAQRLVSAGIFPTLIRYADGPRHGYFRFAISSEHTAEQLDKLAAVLVASRP